MTTPRQAHAAAGRARPQRSEVREALLDAALEEFAQVGYGAASVESIARRAGLTKGAVYGNFDGKFGLFLGLFAPERMDRAAFLDGLTGEPGDPEAALTQFARRIHQRSQFLRPALMIAEARGHVARSPEQLAELAEARSEVVDHLTPLLEAELTRVGLAPVAPMREVVYAVLALVNGIAFEQVGKTEPVVSVAMVERIIRSMVVVAPAEES